MKKIGRNQPCPCGSGKKYKKCCLNKANYDLKNNIDIEKEIEELVTSLVKFNEDTIVNSINRLKEISDIKSISSEQKQNALLGLAQAYQSHGEHYNAIETLGLIECDTIEMETILNNMTAISYNELGDYEKSTEMFDNIINSMDSLKWDDKLKASVYLEAGKAFRCNNEESRAISTWEKAAEIYSKYDDEKNNYSRVKSNIGSILLENSDEDQQQIGINMLEESLEIKSLYGDIEGLANNYCILGIYYWKKKRYQRAISCMRKDLMLSRKAGNKQNLAITLINLAVLYIELKQLTPARSLLNEAKKIGQELNHREIIRKASEGIEEANNIGKEANLNGEIIGPKAICLCGSGKQYEKCCGMADFEPIKLPMHIGGLSKDLEEVHNEFEKEEIESSRMDFILRDTEESNRRLSWARIHKHDGWTEFSELPDMCNYHLISAKTLADESEKEPDKVTKPLSCVILAACSLEAFINQVSFFLHETQKFYEGKYHVIPNELKNGVFEFQRNTELTLKWNLIGQSLCGKLWPPPDNLWNDFKNLIFIRNELVHFKVADYEKIVPPPKNKHEIIKRIPDSVKIRDVQRAWPEKVLTPSLAQWSVKTSESMIKYLKVNYKKNRLNQNKNN